jgi:hypothetical protein
MLNVKKSSESHIFKHDMIGVAGKGYILLGWYIVFVPIVVNQFSVDRLFPEAN